MEKLEKRELVSFDGACPYKCKHCYTFGLNEENKNLSIDDIVESLKEKEFDVIYVSHNKENFINPKEGIYVENYLKHTTKIFWQSLETFLMMMN